MVNSKEVNSIIQKHILEGSKISHSTSYPVIFYMKEKYYLAVFVFFYNREDIEAGAVDRPTVWAIADIETGEKELGFDEGHFADGGGMVRIDVKSPMDLNARVPSGNEMGANDHFVPGGYTDGGAPECVTDNIPNDDTYRKISFFN